MNEFFFGIKIPYIDKSLNLRNFEKEIAVYEVISEVDLGIIQSSNTIVLSRIEDFEGNDVTNEKKLKKYNNFFTFDIGVSEKELAVNPKLILKKQKRKHEILSFEDRDLAKLAKYNLMEYFLEQLTEKTRVIEKKLERKGEFVNSILHKII